MEGGHCGNFYAFWLTTGVLNIVTDLIVLLLPMPHLYGLSMPLYKRLVLMSSFGAGLMYVLKPSSRASTHRLQVRQYSRLSLPP